MKKPRIAGLSECPDSRRRRAGCIAGALTRGEFTDALEAAGLIDISITETHRVHPAAISAIVRATKPTDTATVTTREVDSVESASCSPYPERSRERLSRPPA